jgi:hypothetical protein
MDYPRTHDGTTTATPAAQPAELGYHQSPRRSRWAAVAEWVALLAMAVSLALLAATLTVRLPRIGPSRLAVLAMPIVLLLGLLLTTLALAKPRRHFLGLGLTHLAIFSGYLALMAYHGAPAPADRPVQLLATAAAAVITPWTLWALRREQR